MRGSEPERAQDKACEGNVNVGLTEDLWPWDMSFTLMRLTALYKKENGWFIMKIYDGLSWTNWNKNAGKSEDKTSLTFLKVLVGRFLSVGQAGTATAGTVDIPPRLPRKVDVASAAGNEDLTPEEEKQVRSGQNPPWWNHFKILVGGLEHEFYFSIYWGKSSQLTNIFHRGWNHQAVIIEQLRGIYIHTSYMVVSLAQIGIMIKKILHHMWLVDGWYVSQHEGSHYSTSFMYISISKHYQNI